MPTKGKKTGLFERVGRKIDSAVLWLGERVGRIRSSYRSVNDDYVEKVKSGRILRVLPSSLVLLVLFFMLVPFFTVQIASNNLLALSTENVDGAVSIPKILYKGEIVQKIDFADGQENIVSIGFPIGTFARQNDANYELTIKKDEETIYSTIFSASGLKDNDYKYFDFSPIEIDYNSDYFFSVRALDASEYNAIALYYNSIDGAIVYRAYEKSEFSTLVIIASVVFFVVFLLVNYLVNSGVIKNELSFVVCMSVYAIPLVFIYPINTIPDEFYHVTSAMRLAQYDWAESLSYNTSPRHVIQLPSNSSCITYIHAQPELDTIAECLAPEDDITRVDIMNKIGPTHGLIAYLPTAIGVAFGDLISNSPLVIYYCGRLFSVLTVLAIVIFALSLIKKHRMVILATVMIPMFFQQAASYSYDVLLNALCILVIAYEIRFLTTNVRIRKRDMVIMIIALLTIGLIKMPYLAIAVPLFFIKKKVFNDHKATKWLFIVGTLMLAAIVYVMDGRMVQAGMEGIALDDNNGRGIPLSSLFHFGWVIKVFARTLLTQWSLYITGAIGFFGWFYFALDPVIVVAYIIFLIAVLLSDQENLGKVIRLCTVLAAVVLSGGIFLAMYLSYTMESSLIIEGVQGRYFLPVIPLLLLAMMPRQQKIRLPVNTCYIFFNLIMVCYVITLLIGFY